MKIKEAWIEFILQLQNDICHALENCDGKAKFAEDAWERPEGGGGKSRVIANGNVFEKGGVNTSVVSGLVTEGMQSQLRLPPINGQCSWFACGISLVIHPYNPFVPTVHANYRMFELYNEKYEVVDRWFGGGADLTPYYLFEEDARHFHKTYKDVCDNFDKSFYEKFKEDCDNYFVNWHRNKERRGIGGIFYDYKRPTEDKDANFWMNLARSCGYGFIDSYIPIVDKRKNLSSNPANKHWQEIRRGRYVEFNLVHDRGTIFGLKTNGRIESILISLPPTVRFEYNYHATPGSEEDKLFQACLHPRDWLTVATQGEKNDPAN